MPVLRDIFDVKMVIRKWNFHFRHGPQISRLDWPVISATWPLFYLIRLFGLAPFGISGDHFVSRSYDIIYSLFCILVHTYVVYIVLNKPAIKRDTAMLDIFENSKVIFNYCIVVSNILGAIYTRKRLIVVLNIVHHFDSRIHDLGYPRKERITKIWAWTTCACTVFLWISVSRLGLLAFTESWSENFAYLLAYLAFFLSTIKFSNIVLLLGQRFRHLNNVAQLSKLSATTEQKNIGIDYKVLHQLHNSLMNAGDSLSAQYAWPLMLWLMNLSFHMVSNVYFLIDWIMATPQWVTTQWLLITCLVSWLVTYVAQLLLLHISCHFTSSEANGMGSILINWRSMAVNRNHGIESSLHLINRRLKFSAAGCFCVNLPLLRSITALLTTYLVILKQFHS